MLIKRFEDLKVWQEAHALVLEVYRATGEFPEHERFGLAAQQQRAASSVAANIAEGFGKRSRKEFLRYLEVSTGSLEETRYFLILSRDLKYLEPKTFSALVERLDLTNRLLGGLKKSLAQPRAFTRYSEPGTQHS
jgi:four helix bundle protein